MPHVVAKAGGAQLSPPLALFLAGSGVSVNVVSPGVVETSVRQPAEQIPAGHVGTVVGAAPQFIRSSDSDYVTGQVLEVAESCTL